MTLPFETSTDFPPPPLKNVLSFRLREKPLTWYVVRNSLKYGRFTTLNIPKCEHFTLLVCLRFLVIFAMRRLGSVQSFNPFTSKISLVILLTVCHTVLVMLVWRIWFWINLYSLNFYFSLISSLVCLILYWYCTGKFCLGHSWELKG